MEDQLQAWLESLGYEVQHQQRKSIAALAKSNAAGALQFLMARFKPAAEKQHIDQAVAEWQRRQDAATAGPTLAQQLSELEDELASKNARQQALQRTLESYQVPWALRSGRAPPTPHGVQSRSTPPRPGL